MDQHNILPERLRQHNVKVLAGTEALNSYGRNINATRSSYFLNSQIIGSSELVLVISLTTVVHIAVLYGLSLQGLNMDTPANTSLTRVYVVTVLQYLLKTLDTACSHQLLLHGGFLMRTS